MPHKPAEDLHEIVVKVRLTEKQAKDLEAIAKFYDIPRAVFARKLIHRGLYKDFFDQS